MNPTGPHLPKRGGRQKVVVDLFRLENGKAAEHWDAVQDEPETSLNGHAMILLLLTSFSISPTSPMVSTAYSLFYVRIPASFPFRRFIGEGDFVVIQSEGTVAQNRLCFMIFFDWVTNSS